MWMWRGWREKDYAILIQNYYEHATFSSSSYMWMYFVHLTFPTYASVFDSLFFFSCESWMGILGMILEGIIGVDSGKLASLMKKRIYATSTGTKIHQTRHKICLACQPVCLKICIWNLVLRIKFHKTEQHFWTN